MNNQSAAGLRRSAVAERIRLREEWSALKGTQNQLQSRKDCESIAKQKKTHNWTSKVRSVKNNVGIVGKENKNSEIPMTSEALRGIVALVEVGSASKALALRAALTALGASVMPKWSPLVTHLIWSQGGCRSVRRRARALACRLVSPMWVEACATAARRIPETTFPAAARQSDIPSPRTLRQLLKKAEMENVSIMDLLSDKEEREAKQLRFRVSTDSEANSSGDVTVNTSRDQSNDTIDLGTRVNTAPRRALPASASISPRPPVRSRRKLFTQKEPEAESSTDAESDNENKDRQNKTSKKLTQKDRNGLAQAERMARKMLGQRTDITSARSDAEYRIVLTGMNRDERHEVVECVRALGGRVLSRVNRTTTHVLLGSCRAAPHATDAVSEGAVGARSPREAEVRVRLRRVQRHARARVRGRRAGGPGRAAAGAVRRRAVPRRGGRGPGGGRGRRHRRLQVGLRQRSRRQDEDREAVHQLTTTVPAIDSTFYNALHTARDKNGWRKIVRAKVIQKGGHDPQL
uniref:BRCT domain-containing protein n=1 Tax=Bombyx mori TaxID=7091 RepID=A0A8R2QSU9_BOMMO|nr:uncharacterized protein LOC101746757 isoform X2 [Bombyx mori]